MRSGVNPAIYTAWQNMRRRCDDPTNKSYKDYGAKGVTYCEEWRLYDNFKRDMEPTWQSGLVLDREDNKGNYTKENCRWANGTVSRRNRDYCVVTSGKAEEIRRLYQTGNYTQKKIGEMTGVSRQTVTNVCAGKSWE